MKPKALLLRSAGTNCDVETAYAFELAGAAPEAIHINKLLQNPALLDRFQLMAIPGGFSYGDDIAAGRILANQIAHHLAGPLRAFIDAGKPIIGICNGFQVLAKTELLPGTAACGRAAADLHPREQRLRPVRRSVGSPRGAARKCVWTRDLAEEQSGPAVIELPVAHGEGKFVPADESVRRSLWAGRASRPHLREARRLPRRWRNSPTTPTAASTTSPASATRQASSSASCRTPSATSIPPSTPPGLATSPSPPKGRAWHSSAAPFATSATRLGPAFELAVSSGQSQ